MPLAATHEGTKNTRTATKDKGNEENLDMLQTTRSKMFLTVVLIVIVTNQVWTNDPPSFDLAQ